MLIVNISIKPHARLWKAWAKDRAHYCRHEAGGIDHLCLWCHAHRCCPYYAPEAFGGWRIACRAVQEGHWTQILMQPELRKIWKDRENQLVWTELHSRGLVDVPGELENMARERLQEG